ncbi:hypothetical protein QO002_000559 [Pararhizobium capsulatum DSM 1112]|uniref:Uncharacterized protein n=1 Tax=Pararhizobium capsulatum DSM 1112 TaxID=1121113 RepID=A0ABU0BJI9_9HYPH|nr:hypothetical protein [Pararhizobium capsulatum DSM 1112]
MTTTGLAAADIRNEAIRNLAASHTARDGAF